MDEKTIRLLVEAGGVRQIHIIADGGRFHVDDPARATGLARHGYKHRCMVHTSSP